MKPLYFLPKFIALTWHSENVTMLKYERTLNPNIDEIFDVRIDQQNFYWISGPNYTGRFKLVNDSLILVKAYTVQDGLAETSVTEMHIDHENRVWCFTGSGINCIDQESGEIRYFGVQEGLPQVFIDPRQVISLPDQRIATVNKNGLIIFHPDSLWNVGAAGSVQVAINNIRLNGNDVTGVAAPNYLSSYSIEPGKNVVDIQFQGLSYPTAQQLNYSYRLKGFQEEWIDIGKNNSVTLSGLSSGNYVFQVKAGTISSTAPIKELKIYIPVPFFKKWWVVLFMFLMLGSLLYFIYQYRINKVKEEEKQKTKVNKKIAELELQALRSQMNPHFMFNSLNSIKNFILRSEPKQAAEYLSNFSHLIRMILQNSREKTISLQEELESLMLYIELEQLRFDEEFTLNCEIGEGVQMEQVLIPPMILQPYIENAIWHGLMHKKGKGLLSLIFQKCDGHICCIIQDNGVGREKAMELKNKSIRKYKSMGMGITRDRIELVNKMDSLGISVEIQDLTEAVDGQTGTKVIVRITSAICERKSRSMIKAILIDDERSSLESLAFEIDAYCTDVKVVGSSRDPEEGIELIKSLKPDLVFLDIEMPGMNGFELLQSFPAIPFDVIFVTAYDQFAIRAFEFNAIDYILKPVRKIKLVQAVEKVKNKMQHHFDAGQLAALMQNLQVQSKGGLEKIALPIGDGFSMVHINDIAYLNADSNYTWVYMADGKKHLIAKTLKEIEGMLNFAQYLRVHKSYSVNLNHIDRYVRGQGGYLITTDGVQIPVSRAQKSELMERLKDRTPRLQFTHKTNTSLNPAFILVLDHAFLKKRGHEKVLDFYSDKFAFHCTGPK